MNENPDFLDELRGSVLKTKPKQMTVDAVFELPKDESALFDFLRKHGEKNNLTLLVEGKDVRMKNVSLKLRFLGIVNDVIYCLSKSRTSIKILGVTTNERVFNSKHEDVLARNVGVAIGKPRPPYKVTTSLKDLIKWTKKVSVPSDGRYTLRLFLRGEYLGQRHYVQGLFASSDKGTLNIERKKKGFLSLVKDVALLPIKIPFKIVELFGQELLKLFAKSAEEGMFFVNLERASFQYRAQFMSVGDSKNATFKPNLYVAELSKVAS